MPSNDDSSFCHHCLLQHILQMLPMKHFYHVAANLFQKLSIQGSICCEMKAKVSSAFRLYICLYLCEGFIIEGRAYDFLGFSRFQYLYSQYLLIQVLDCVFSNDFRFRSCFLILGFRYVQLIGFKGGIIGFQK